MCKVSRGEQEQEQEQGGPGGVEGIIEVSCPDSRLRSGDSNTNDAVVC